LPRLVNRLFGGFFRKFPELFHISLNDGENRIVGGIELRTITAIDLRSIAGADGKSAKIGGYAAVFNSPSEDLGGFREILAPGAFRETLSGGADIRALFSHDPDKLLGRTSNGTLRLHEDDKGLAFECDVPDTSYARDMMALIGRGDIKKMSFGFNVPSGGESWDNSAGVLTRTVKTAQIGEVSIVSNPAYRGTDLSIRVDPAVIATVQRLNKPEPKFNERRNIAMRFLIPKGTV
jgi:hypothetical protein